MFSLWSLGQENVFTGKTPIRRTYMEGKLAIVDDVWMTLGTAKVDGMSMASFETSDNRSPAAAFIPLQSLMETKRSAELDGVLFDGIAGAPSTGVVAQTRCEAWREHLGTVGTNTCTATMPNGGWLPIWNGIAQRNVQTLNQNPPIMSGRILPWVPGGMVNATSQLNALGISLNRLDVRQD